ncbi:hypothetical protein CERZMDRAFT_49365 [Cercospora zeae-maydis SCOH1-5]|uniref:Carboxypeptidase M14B n=1 Tax=Cercospora zeae-maydis SCOH1-5 TaxID=717836 RepID=A0A6A6F3R6_9PEZI|nr:hypothetical protein CERZMDRAFT_49365 [Cercospora zeae-maydis SCOH1-5]
MYTSISLSLLLGLVSASRYGNNQVPVTRDPPQVEKNFPDPGITLISPAFIQNNTTPPGFSNGTAGPTSQAILDVYIQALADRNSWVKYSPVDYQSEEGRDFSYVLLTSCQQSNYTYSPSSDKVRIWIQGGVHGNEPGGDQAVMALLGKMDANQTWTNEILQQAEIMVLPRYNPDGVAYFQRAFASNFDPNRDHVKLARQQSRDIKKTFSDFAPHIAVDLHEYGPNQVWSGTFIPGADAMFSAAKNLNIDAAIRNMSEQVFAPAIGAHLESQGFRWEPYALGGSESDARNATIVLEEADSDAKIGRNAMGLTQAIVFLFETRGIGLADQEFARRTATGLALLEATINTAIANAPQVLQTVESSIETFVQSTDPIIILDSPQEPTIRNWTVIDYRTGELQQTPIIWLASTPTIANLTRPRPEAYLIPAAWKDLMPRLEASGLEIQTLSEPFSGPVEALTIQTSGFNEPAYFEGAVLATVTTTSATRNVQLPAGSFLISTRQKNAGLAFAALEPEGMDSYVSFGVVPLAVGDEYPIYRVFSWA